MQLRIFIVSKMSEFLNGVPSDPAGEKIDGHFGCSKCDEYVLEAYFDEAAGKLRWQCEKDHITEVNVV